MTLAVRVRAIRARFSAMSQLEVRAVLAVTVSETRAGQFVEGQTLSAFASGTGKAAHQVRETVEEHVEARVSEHATQVLVASASERRERSAQQFIGSDEPSPPSL